MQLPILVFASICFNSDKSICDNFVKVDSFNVEGLRSCI